MKRICTKLLILLLSVFAVWEIGTASGAGAEGMHYWINPNGGTKYHWVRCCPSIHPRYRDGMIEITEEQLKLDPYNMLSPCNVCRDLDPAEYDLPAAETRNGSTETNQSDDVESRVVMNAKGYLTEVYGYTEAQADQFVFLFHPEGELEYWPDEDHSAYCYRLYFDSSTGKTREASTPFYDGGFENYPGEGNIRQVVHAFLENDWLHRWDRKAMEEFSRKIQEWGEIVPTEKLTAGLKSGDITSREAMREFFLSCFGPEETWTKATALWLKELLDEDAADSGNPENKGRSASHLQDEQVDIELKNGSHCAVNYYVETIPEEAKLYRFTDQGWRLKEGILADYILPPGNMDMQDTFDRGFFVLEKAGQRMGVTLIRKDGAWESHAAGPCVLSDRDFTMNLQTGGPELTFRIEYETREGKSVSCNCHVDSKAYLHLDNYSITEEPGGDRFLLYAEGSGKWFWLDRRSGQETAGGGDPRYTSAIDAMMRFAELPDSPESYSEWNRFPFPDRFYSVVGVHLRERTSSRSRDLGLLNPGTVLQKTGEAAGDPFPWFQVKLGMLDGYVVSQYVCVDDAGVPTADYDDPLPVAEAIRKTDLKSGTGWFDGKVAEVPEGTRMHVLFERDGWYYVVIPREDLGFCMDVEGQYGFIPKDTVRMGLTLFDLDWK